MLIQPSHTWICCAATLLAVSGSAMGQQTHGQQGKPPLELVEQGVRVEPVRIAPALIENGQVVRVGEWQDYATPRTSQPCTDQRIFDCYGDHNFDGYPDDAGGCSLSGSRWFFGTAYCEGFYSNDMTLAEDTVLEAGAWRADAAWYWTGDGSEKYEQCVLAVFTEESDAQHCEPDSFDYPAWLIDFGYLQTNPGFYYFAWMDISLYGTWPLPPAGSGSYGIFFLTDGGRVPAACASPMLWGSSNTIGGDPDGPGEQFTMQMDDDNPIDWEHMVDGTTNMFECYDYTFGVCPGVLGGMLQFWGTRANPTRNRADYNEDGQVNTTDFTTYLNAWTSCHRGADCDHDGNCTTKDILCFLDIWVTCGS